MAIKSIQDLCLYSNLAVFRSPRRSLFQSPIITLTEKHSFRIVASIHVELRDSWHVKNVVAKDKYGPTIYKVLMELSREHGIAPARKIDGYSPEYITDKPRQIWRRFTSSQCVTCTPITDTYDDDWLNNKFVSKESEVDLEAALKNLKSAIRESYILSNEKKQSRPPCLKRRYIDYGYRRFIEHRIRQIHRESIRFLEQSLNGFR